ncbi:MAG: DUF2510 domain-containing protein, partial [Acidimicrobiales bacterium]
MAPPYDPTGRKTPGRVRARRILTIESRVSSHWPPRPSDPLGSPLPPGATAPGWFPVPYNPGQLRWWDGQAWSTHAAQRQAWPPSAPTPAPGAGTILAPAGGAVPR